MAEKWERQKKEGPKPFEAFVIYRNMGADRSLSKVARQLGKSNALIERWSREHGWVDRCQAWDNEQDRILRKQQQDEIKKMRSRHANLATAMLVKATKALTRIPDDEIKASDISRMVEIASKLERISRGDVGDVVEQREAEEKQLSPVMFYMPSNGRNPELEQNTVDEPE